MTQALIICNMQYDHLPGGPLPIDGSDLMLNRIRMLVTQVKQEDGIVIATREWHPANHFSFTEQYDGHEPLPVHCVEATRGAKIHTSIRKYADYIISLGVNRNEEGYSAFQGKTLRPVHDLEKILAHHEVDTVLVAGIRFGVEVAHTALDANAIGYHAVISVPCTDFNIKDPSYQHLVKAGVMFDQLEEAYA